MAAPCGRITLLAANGSRPRQTRGWSSRLCEARAGGPQGRSACLLGRRIARVRLVAPQRGGSSMAQDAKEHAKAPAVVRVIELVGVSNKSWSDAAQQAVDRASETIRHITGVDVFHSTAVVRDRKIVEYHVNVKLAF